MGENAFSDAGLTYFFTLIKDNKMNPGMQQQEHVSSI